MRRKKTDVQRRVNGDVAIEFGDEGMTSYAGLELLIRYLRRIGFNAQVRRHLSAVVHGGDFGVVALPRQYTHAGRISATENLDSSAGNTHFAIVQLYHKKAENAGLGGENRDPRTNPVRSRNRVFGE